MTAREQARQEAVRKRTGPGMFVSVVMEAADTASDVWQPKLEAIRNIICNETEMSDTEAFVRILKICKEALG